jgi:hypothetical protein
MPVPFPRKTFPASTGGFACNAGMGCPDFDFAS